jgi:hypothetical protein
MEGAAGGAGAGAAAGRPAWHAGHDWTKLGVVHGATGRLAFPFNPEAQAAARALGRRAGGPLDEAGRAERARVLAVHRPLVEALKPLGTTGSAKRTALNIANFAHARRAHILAIRPEPRGGE